MLGKPLLNFFVDSRQPSTKIVRQTPPSPLGSVHISRNQVGEGGEGELLKMVMLDYGGGGRGKWV